MKKQAVAPMQYSQVATVLVAVNTSSIAMLDLLLQNTTLPDGREDMSVATRNAAARLP